MEGGAQNVQRTTMYVRMSTAKGPARSPGKLEARSYSVGMYVCVYTPYCVGKSSKETMILT